jgi:hypothetical protein
MSPQLQGCTIILPGTGLPFRCLLRLPWLRWRYSNPLPEGNKRHLRKIMWHIHQILGNYSKQTNKQFSSQRGGGFVYLHPSTESRRGWRKENPVPVEITEPINWWGIWTRGPGPPNKGSLQSERVKYSHESRDSDPRSTALLKTSSNYERQTRLSSERILRKEHGRKSSAAKWKSLVLSLKGFGTKTKLFAVNSQ